MTRCTKERRQIPTLVQVFGETELIQHIRSGGEVFDHLISVGNPRRFLGPKNPGETMPHVLRQSFRRYLRLAFFDVERRDQLGPMRPKRIVSIRDIEKIIRFYRQTKHSAQGYTIHCWRGVSRSAAVALGILYMMTGSEELAKEELRRTRPEAMPLKLVIRLFDNVLGSNLAPVNEVLFKERIEEWKNELDLDSDILLEELPVVDENASDECIPQEE